MSVRLGLNPDGAKAGKRAKGARQGRLVDVGGTQMHKQRYGTSNRPLPATTAELDAGERLILRAFRYWVVGLAEDAGTQLSLAWNELARDLGAEHGKAAMSGLIGLVRELQHARRRLQHLPPCCLSVTTDEMALLTFVGACQRKEWPLARGLAEWLVRANGVGGLLESGARLGRALAEADLSYPARHGTARARPCSPEIVTRRATL